MIHRLGRNDVGCVCDAVSHELSSRLQAAKQANLWPKHGHIAPRGSHVRGPRGVAYLPHIASYSEGGWSQLTTTDLGAVKVCRNDEGVGWHCRNDTSAS